MVNRLTRPLQAPGGNYDPRPVLPDGLPDIARSAGEELTGEIRAADRVAQIGAEYGDAIARQEGQQAAQRDALSPEWRPSNDTSIRGRSYDATGVKTYENLLDSRLRTEFMSAQQAWAAEPPLLENGLPNPNAYPAALSARFDAITARMGRDDVFDAIRGSFEASQTLLRLPFLRAAQDRFDERGRQTALASSGDVNRQSREMQARAGQAAPGPESERVIDTEHEAQVARAEGDFRNGLITAQQREARIAEADASRLESTWGPRVARAVTDEELQRVRQQAIEARDAGRLPPTSFGSVETAIERRQRQLQVEGRRSQAEATRAATGFLDQLRTQEPPSEVAAAQISGQFPATPEGELARATFNAQRRIVMEMRGRTEEEGQSIVDALSRTSNKRGNPASVASIAQFARDEQTRRATALRQDMLGLARADGLTVSSLGLADFAAMPNASPEQLAQSFGRRVSEAEAIARQYGRAPQFFTAEERARIGEVMELPGDKQLGVITALVRGAGSQARQAFAEISTRAPTLAQAGAIMAANPNDPQARQTARDMLEGLAIARVPGARTVNIPAAIERQRIDETYGQAFVGVSTEEQKRVEASAAAIARARATRQGVNLEDSSGDRIHREALIEATGGRVIDGVQFGGPAPYRPSDGLMGGQWFASQARRVLVPPEVRADRFHEVIRRISADDLGALPEAQQPRTLDGRPFSPADLAAAVPVRVGSGYQFVLGDPTAYRPRYITNSTGGRFVLPWSDDLSQRLRERLPGAFR
jgi:hypothetical protein